MPFVVSVTFWLGAQNVFKGSKRGIQSKLYSHIGSEIKSSIKQENSGQTLLAEPSSPDKPVPAEQIPAEYGRDEPIRAEPNSAKQSPAEPSPANPRAAFSIL